MGKKEQFEKLLKDAGVTEYWCSSDFNPCMKYPNTKIVIPIINYKLAVSILDLYNDYEDNMNCSVEVVEKDNGFFNFITKDLERRVL